MIDLHGKRSFDIMSRSYKVFPGGVNSPVRSFSSVGGQPIVFKKGHKSFLYDVDGNKYVDFCSSWGPLILGYSHPRIIDVIKKQALKALSFGAPSEEELLLGEKIKCFIKDLELMRFVSSGTEATMSAIRVARGYTKKNKIIKFKGCYHGHSNDLLVAAGSGLATFGTPSSQGVTKGSISDTLLADYNSKDDVEALFKKYPNDIAAIIVEPVAANMGLVLPEKGFLEFLRDVTANHSSLLIFDEVMTGFRLSKGGASELFNVKSDLYTYGKIIGGGLPVAAYGGKKEIMSCVSPLGGVYQAGTLSGCPLAMACGLETLKVIEEMDAYSKLEKIGQVLDELVSKTLKHHIEAGKLFYTRIGSMFCFFVGLKEKPKTFAQVCQMNEKLFSKLYEFLLKNGLYFGPSAYETAFLNVFHEESDLKHLVDVIGEFFRMKDNA